jgi:hypothetical protein
VAEAEGAVTVTDPASQTDVPAEPQEPQAAA